MTLFPTLWIKNGAQQEEHFILIRWNEDLATDNYSQLQTLDL